MSADALGLIGLGVMGQALALRLAESGARVAVYDTGPEARAAAARCGLACAADPAALVKTLAPPRTLLLMVPAGEAVETAIAELAPLLAPGDSLLDGGNSHFKDSARRAGTLAGRGIRFLGVGISGGEAGARHGAAIMAGGDETAYRDALPLLQAVAAEVEGEPCCAWFGPAGAGHFVKCLHNGIEYAAMQLLAEAYALLRELARLSAFECADVFADWARGPLAGFLVELAAQVLRKRDPESGRALVDEVLDAARQKGTGQWAAAAALELGRPAPIMAAAVHARALSALEPERLAAAAAAPAARLLARSAKRLPFLLGEALYGAMIAAYAEGFAVLGSARRDYGWPLELARVAQVWRGGCILRARVLEPIRAAYARAPELVHLALDSALGKALATAERPWRRVLALGAARGIPLPAFAAALSSLDGYRGRRLGAELVQAQRDAFGRHGFERRDRPGSFHAEWDKP